MRPREKSMLFGKITLAFPAPFIHMSALTIFIVDAGWSSPVARQAHNLKVRGSNPLPAPNFTLYLLACRFTGFRNRVFANVGPLETHRLHLSKNT